MEQDDNPFAIVVLTVLLALKKKKLDDQGLYELKYALARNLLSKKFPRKKIDDLLVFLQRYVSFVNQEYNTKFEKGINTHTGKHYNMGIREQVLDLAKEEGIEKGKREVVRNMLATRSFNIATIASLVGVSEEFVREVERKDLI